jgi:translation initiation factor 1 (eIF-1/SUI1)
MQQLILIRKGTLSPITLTVKTRQGRKTVTHVVGLEAFGVEIDEFAEELRKLCAGSASGGWDSKCCLDWVSRLLGSRLLQM